MKRRVICIVIGMVVLLSSGCASPGKAPGRGTDDKDKYPFLKGMDDEKALETTVAIYNARPENYQDEQVRLVALQEFMDALRNRDSELISESGVFDLEYKDPELEQWPDEKILDIYEYLDQRIKNTNVAGIMEAGEEENSWRMIYMVSRDALAREGKRREGLRAFWKVFSQVLNVALAVAISVI